MTTTPEAAPVPQLLVKDTDSVIELAGRIEGLIETGAGLMLLTDSKVSYNIAIKAVATATRWVAALGIYLACETFFRTNAGRFAERDKMKVLIRHWN